MKRKTLKSVINYTFYLLFLASLLLAYKKYNDGSWRLIEDLRNIFIEQRHIELVVYPFLLFWDLLGAFGEAFGSLFGPDPRWIDLSVAFTISFIFVFYRFIKEKILNLTLSGTKTVAKKITRTTQKHYIKRFEKLLSLAISKLNPEERTLQRANKLSEEILFNNFQKLIDSNKDSLFSGTVYEIVIKLELSIKATLKYVINHLGGPELKLKEWIKEDING